MNDYRTIVVGTDGSQLSEPTVARAAWLAAHHEADLVIVCVYSALTRRQAARSVATRRGGSRVGTVLGRAAANDAMSAALGLAHGHGATVTAALLMDGEPAEALLATAAERGADLIVIGTRREISLAERLLGTVVSEIVRRASCEVLVVHPPVNAADPTAAGTRELAAAPGRADADAADPAAAPDAQSAG